MEILNLAEVWRFKEETDDWEFSHTSIVATNGHDVVYFAKAEERQKLIKGVNSYQWNPIPMDHIYPQFPPHLSAFEGEITSQIYHKKPRFITYDGSSDLAQALLDEAEIYQRLRNHDSPSLARFHGCIVLNGRIIGLALTKYDQTLDARMKQPFGRHEAERWLSQIRQGMEVVHGYSLAHNDLSPWNVMISNENAVIIDFDSCRPLGEELVKCGTPDWSDDTAEVSAIANDLYCLHRIAVALGVAADTKVMESGALTQ